MGEQEGRNKILHGKVLGMPPMESPGLETCS